MVLCQDMSHVCMCLVAQFAYNIISVLSAVTSREDMIFVYCTMQRSPGEERQGVGTEGQKASLQSTPQTISVSNHMWCRKETFYLIPPWTEQLLKLLPKRETLPDLQRDFQRFFNIVFSCKCFHLV